MRGLVVVLIAGCGFTPGQLGSGDATIVDVPNDISIDAPATTCYARWLNGTIRFAPPIEVPMVNSAAFDRDPFLTPDERTLYLSSGRSMSNSDLFVAKRASTTANFNTPARDPAFDDMDSGESKLSISSDGLLAVVGSSRAGSQMLDVWSSTRATVNDNWGTLTNVPNVNTVGNDHDPTISGDGLNLYLAPQNLVDPQYLAVATRTGRIELFGTPTPIVELNSGMGDADPSTTPDERIIVFATSRSQPDAMLGNVWYSTRASKMVSFAAPMAVPDINTNASEGDPHLSVDGCRIYFSRDLGSGNWNIFVATALP